jgi:hypothetical protein
MNHEFDMPMSIAHASMWEWEPNQCETLGP